MLDALTDLTAMSLKDLRQLQNQVDAALAEKIEQETEAAKAKVKELAEEIGCEPELLVERTGRAPARKKYGDEEGNTWTGKGRTPSWLQEKLDAGAKLEDFLLK